MSIRTLLDHHQRQVNRKAWSDLGSFAASLEKAGQLKTVTDAVSPELEITGLCHRSLVNGGPALAFNKVEGHEMPVLGNLFGNERRMLMALELESREDLRALGSQFAFLKNPELPDSIGKAIDSAPGFARMAHATPVHKSEAPWQENVLEGPDVDLAALPISTCWPGDAGPLITWGLVITRGPNKPRINLAIYRLQLIGRNKLIMRWLSANSRQPTLANPTRFPWSSAPIPRHCWQPSPPYRTHFPNTSSPDCCADAAAAWWIHR